MIIIRFWVSINLDLQEVSINSGEYVYYYYYHYFINSILKNHLTIPITSVLIHFIAADNLTCVNENIDDFDVPDFIHLLYVSFFCFFL